MGTLASELGDHLDRKRSVPRVYVDANVPAPLVTFMRTKLRWDVFAVIEHDDLRRATDLAHFRLARQMRRTLVSLDRDYLDDKRFPRDESGGVVVLSAPDERGFIRLLRRLAREWTVEAAKSSVGATPAAPPLVGAKRHLQPGGGS